MNVSKCKTLSHFNARLFKASAWTECESHRKKKGEDKKNEKEDFSQNVNSKWDDADFIRFLRSTYFSQVFILSKHF